MQIIRFRDPDGLVHWGANHSEGMATIFEGSLFDLKLTKRRVIVNKILAPIDPRAILCIGLNYRKHAEETGQPLPERPVLFMKNPAAVQNPGDPIIIPACCQKQPEVDFEVELAVIIGRTTRGVSAEQALEYVFGYTIANDVSARRWQKNGGAAQWVRGKSFDTFCPLGPVIVTADEIPDPQALRLTTTLNGEIMQDSNTSDMIFSVAQLIEALSDGMTLLPGTVILTGTPSGVGFAREPRLFLKDGDQITLEIDKLGQLSNPVVAEPV